MSLLGWAAQRGSATGRKEAACASPQRGMHVTHAQGTCRGSRLLPTRCSALPDTTAGGLVSLCSPGFVSETSHHAICAAVTGLSQGTVPSWSARAVACGRIPCFVTAESRFTADVHPTFSLPSVFKGPRGTLFLLSIVTSPRCFAGVTRPQ